MSRDATLPADVLTGAEQLSLPPGCKCGYALSRADGGRREGATQSEVVRKGLEALEREQEAGTDARNDRGR